eukprot:764389-Hanusia_phi.AAC.3
MSATVRNVELFWMDPSYWEIRLVKNKEMFAGIVSSACRVVFVTANSVLSTCSSSRDHLIRPEQVALVHCARYHRPHLLPHVEQPLPQQPAQGPTHRHDVSHVARLCALTVGHDGEHGDSAGRQLHFDGVEEGGREPEDSTRRGVQEAE